MGGPAVGGAPACLASNGEGNGAVAWTSDGQEGRADERANELTSGQRKDGRTAATHVTADAI